MMVRSLEQTKFVWRGLALHLGRRKKPVLTLVADATYPHLYRIRYPNGWTSTPANLTRAKDAAYESRPLFAGGTEALRGPTDGRKAGCLMWGR